ncbi:MAG: glutaminyl-peptide cyclotransferase [Rikenellaceae bacterium]
MKPNKLIYLLLLLLASCIGQPSSATKATPQKHIAPKYYTYIIRNIYPHATNSYTQGLQYIDSEMWESTGLEGQSRLMKVDLQSGKTDTVATLLDSEFGEGMTLWGDSIFMITWQSNKLYIFDRTSGDVIDTKQYHGEGWGITTDGTELYMSSGSSRITRRNPQTFKRLGEIDVSINGRPLEYINELEWIEGRIWANIYTLDQVVIINPTTGIVEGVVDFSGLLSPEDITDQTDVLNGIAYDEKSGRIFVTGKNWNKLFEVEIVER